MLSLYLLPCMVFFTLFCSSNPQNPYSNPDNVTISMILPDSTHAVYTKDTFSVKIKATLTSLIDSMVLSAGSIKDSSFQSILDTFLLKFISKDTGSITIKATAYCKNNVVKSCHGIVHVHKNPLEPPDTVYTKALSDTAIFIYWKKISVAKKYMVYRSLAVADTTAFSLIKTITDTSYTDISLSAATPYYYRIASVDSLNRQSDLSSIYKETTSAVYQSKWDEIVWDQDKWE
jgi:hypothetical protein